MCKTAYSMFCVKMHTYRAPVCSMVCFIRYGFLQYCVGGGGHFPEAAHQCGDFTSFDWDGYGSNNGWSASKDMTESALLLFYR